MFTFLLVVQALIAASLVGVILMQQSEGGGLGMGGSPTGLMSARGAANFLTRATGILAGAFVTLSILLAVVATQRSNGTAIDTSLARKPAPATPAPVVPLSGAPVPVPGLPGASPVSSSVNPPPPSVDRKEDHAKPVLKRERPKPTADASVTPPPVATTAPAASPKAETAPAGNAN